MKIKMIMINLESGFNKNKPNWGFNFPDVNIAIHSS